MTSLTDEQIAEAMAWLDKAAEAQGPSGNPLRTIKAMLQKTRPAREFLAELRANMLEDEMTELELKKAIKDYIAAVVDNEGVTFINKISNERSREIVQFIFENP